jgi:hypothetical protein
VEPNATSLHISAPDWKPSTAGIPPFDQEDVNAFIDFVQRRGLRKKTEEVYRSAADTFASLTAAHGMRLLAGCHA